MNGSNVRRLISPVLLLLVCALAPAVAQQPEPEGQAPPVFFEQVDVEVTNLDVVVTGRDGEPTLGLDRDDFTVLVDGEPVEIVNFYAVEPEGAPPAVAAEAETAKAAPGPAPGAAPQPLQLAVVVDLRSLPFGGERRQALASLADGIAEGLRPGDRVLVATLDTQLSIRQHLTDDWVVAADTLEAVASEKARVSNAAIERQRIMQELNQVLLPSQGGAAFSAFEGAAAEADASRIFSSIELYARQREVEAHATLQLLQRFIDWMSGLVGRKTVLLVSGGIEDRPGQALMDAWRTKFSNPAYGVDSNQAGRRIDSLSGRFRDLGAYANTRQVTFYTVGTGSTGISSMISAENQGNVDVGGGRPIDSTFESTLRGEMAMPLQVLAAETGGVAQVHSTAFGNLVDQIRQDSRAYYSLGVRLRIEGDEQKRRRVEVKVAHEGLKVRHRSAVQPRTPQQKAAEATMARLMHDDGSNELGAAIAFGEEERDEEGRLLLPVTVRFPFVNLLMVPEGDQHVGQLTMFVVAVDRQGDLSTTQTIELPIRIPSSAFVEALQGAAEYRMQLEIRPGWHRVAIGLHDEIGNVTSTLAAEHEVRDPDAG